MKRRRISKPQGSTVTDVPFKGAARIVTLQDPTAGATMAQGAFARLDPPPDHPPAEVESWRAEVAAVALAVRVLPTRRSADVPLEEARPRADRGADVRREAMEIARERGGELLEAAVASLFESVASWPSLSNGEQRTTEGLRK